MKLLKRLFFSKKNQATLKNSTSERPKSRVFEKVVMGAIIGGAIGSVVGASIKSRSNKTPGKSKFSLLKRLLGIKKKIPIETDKKDL